MRLVVPKTESRRWAPRTPNTVTPATPIPTINPVDPNTTAPAPPPAVPTLPPEAVKGTRIEAGEAQSITAVQRDIIDFALHHSLRRRQVYAWLWVNPSNAADYMAKLEIVFWRNYSRVGTLPLAAALSSVAGTVQETVATAFVVGGNIIADSILIYIAQPTGTQPNSVIVQPRNLMVEADRVTVSVLQFVNMTGIRVWLGVVSSEP